MQSHINPPYRLKSPSSSPIIYEFSIDKPGKKFEVWLLEDSAGVKYPPINMESIYNPGFQWIFAGGYWVLQIPRVTKPGYGAGIWKYKFICENEEAFCNFDLISYTYGLAHLTETLSPILREGFGWKAVSNPERSWCKQRYIATLTWAIEKVRWEYQFADISIMDGSGPGGADISPNGQSHPAGVHAGGMVLDWSYPKTDKGDINFQALFDIIYEAVRQNPRIHFSIHSTISEGLGFIVPPSYITIDDDPRNKHDQHVHSWQE